jgi:hypothetical protein
VTLSGRLAHDAESGPVEIFALGLAGWLWHTVTITGQAPRLQSVPFIEKALAALVYHGMPSTDRQHGGGVTREQPGSGPGLSPYSLRSGDCTSTVIAAGFVRQIHRWHWRLRQPYRWQEEGACRLALLLRNSIAEPMSDREK